MSFSDKRIQLRQSLSGWTRGFFGAVVACVLLAMLAVVPIRGHADQTQIVIGETVVRQVTATSGRDEQFVLTVTGDRQRDVWVSLHTASSIPNMIAEFGFHLYNDTDDFDYYPEDYRNGLFVFTLKDVPPGTYNAGWSIFEYCFGEEDPDTYEIVASDVVFTKTMTIYYDEVSGGNETIPDNVTSGSGINSAAGMSAWAEESISELIEMDIIPAAMRGNYLNSITREEFAVLVVRFIIEEGSYDYNEGLGPDVGGFSYEYILTENFNKEIEKSNFTDTATWEVDVAYCLGIVSGIGNGRFDPNGLITREQAAVMLTNAAALYPGIAAEEEVKFLDAPVFSEWARNGIRVATGILATENTKLMGGVGNDLFDPKGTFTREQAMATVYRLYQAYNLALLRI